MLVLEDLFKIFEEYRMAHRFEGEVGALYEPANYLMDLGGKRLRPLLALLAYQLYDEDVRPALPAALAIEVFHNFSLMHDDIMDASPLRRGRPTTHMQFDLNAAILSGDWMLIHTYTLLSSYNTQLPEVLTIMNKVAREVCEGQQLDMQFESKSVVTEAEYLQMIRNKTAVLLGAALQMGATIANSSVDDQNQLYLAGIKAGLSFQLTDDYLDAFSADSGKIIGGDIRQNKKTLLFIHAYEQAVNKSDLVQLAASSADNKVEKILNFYSETGSDLYVKNLALQYGQEAIELIESLNIPASKKSNLTNLFNDLLHRTK